MSKKIGSKDALGHKQFCLTKGKINIELCRAQLCAEQPGEDKPQTQEKDKGQRKLLQPRNWMLLLKVAQTVQQSLLLPPLTHF